VAELLLKGGPVATRATIERAIHTINRVENDMSLTPQQRSDGIDPVMAPGVQGWGNGTSRGSREEEKASEVALWEAFPNYQRTIERVIIDGDHAAFCWHATLRNDQEAIELWGTTVADFDDQGRLTRFWLYYDEPQTGPQ
jgi:hypothetical protein